MDGNWKDRLRHKIANEYGNLITRDSVGIDELKGITARALDELAMREKIYLSIEEKQKIVSELVNEFVGLGPLDPILKDPLVTEIMINGTRNVYIEKAGKKEKADLGLLDEKLLMFIVYKILASTRRRVDESCPFADVSLKEDGSRVNIIIPPLALDGPTITIRKFTKELMSAEDLIKAGTLDRRMADFLVACIKAKVNIIFSGATGSGKTTTLNVFSSYISPNERIITIEDTAELRLAQEHVVRLETKQSNIEGKGEITLRDLFKNSLRMRPERIILGEIRGAEALDMLQAICSGHTGSLAILHANSPQDVVYRLETMILTSGLNISLEAIHRQIVTAVNLIVQQEQLPDGSRKITHITQVHGLNNAQVVLEDLFTYELESFGADGMAQGKWKASGITPVFSGLFKKSGINLPTELFNKD